MPLLHELTRCLGDHAGSRCDRADQCARHVALRTDGPDAYRSCADRLCYSGYSFFIDQRNPMDHDRRYRDPDTLTARDVCPHCKTETAVYLVSCDGHIVETHRCAQHGDVVPMRSHVSRDLAL